MSCSLQDYNTRGFRLSVRMLLTSISGKRRTGNSVSTRTHYAGTSTYDYLVWFMKQALGLDLKTHPDKAVLLLPERFEKSALI